MKKNFIYLGLSLLLLSLTACESGDNEFDDFDYQTVYFANQYALRTVELGEDIEDLADLTADNNHMISIKAAWGGGYTNRKNIVIDYVIDESLCDNLYFKADNDAGDAVLPMPSNYYELQADKIYINEGQILGGVDVYLTDAFFSDPKTTEATYVIPLRMTNVVGADSILLGKASVDNPSWTSSDDWSTQPQNFVLYAVKYVNPWHGQYLRRGTDIATINGTTSSLVRHEQYVENDEVVNISTLSLHENILPITVKDASGINVTFNLKLTFTDDGDCTLSSNTDDVVVTGSGKFVKKGEKNSLGGKDRNAIYLDYNVNFTAKDMQFASKDTLVLRTRNVYGASTFNVIKK